MGSIADALFSKTQQRVLGIVFGEPDRSFLGTEVIQRAAVGRGSVQRELSRLVDTGLVTVRRVGNQTRPRPRSTD
jgi:DNA-binding MarR family transcriptional regulator